MLFAPFPCVLCLFQAQVPWDGAKARALCHQSNKRRLFCFHITFAIQSLWIFVLTVSKFLPEAEPSLRKSILKRDLWPSDRIWPAYMYYSVQHMMPGNSYKCHVSSLFRKCLWSNCQSCQQKTLFLVKGTVSRDFFASGSFHESVSPQPQSIPLRPFQIFVENSLRYTQLKVCHRWHRWQMEKIFNQKNFNNFVWSQHRWQICHRCQQHKRNWWQNLPPVSLIPGAICHRCHWHRWCTLTC